MRAFLPALALACAASGAATAVQVHAERNHAAGENGENPFAFEDLAARRRLNQHDSPKGKSVCDPNGWENVSKALLKENSTEASDARYAACALAENESGALAGDARAACFSDCRYGRENAAAEPGEFEDCPRGKKKADVQTYQCRCLTQAHAKDYNAGGAETLTTIGAILAGGGGLASLVITVLLLNGKCQKCLRDCDGKQGKPTESAAVHCCGLCMVVIWPYALCVGGIVMIVMGATRNLDEFAVACGEDDRGLWQPDNPI